MEGYIDLKRLNLEELVGVVNLYPWFAGARKEICTRLSAAGDDALKTGQVADSAMHLPSRKILSDMMRKTGRCNLADSDVGSLIKSYVSRKDNEPKRRVYAGAGDYFSQEEYDHARKEGDNVFSRYASKSRRDNAEYTPEPVVDQEFDIFTETLAQIYAEQGYYEQAKDIYSKLILAYPEKNAYFAALIQKMDELN